MKHFTIRFLSLMVFTFVSFVSFGQYCTSGGPTSALDSNLDAFSVTGANSTSINHTGNCTATGVEDLTSTTNVDMVAGMTYTGSVTWGTCGGNFGNAGTIWIDWDADGVFGNNPNEAVHTWSGTPITTEVVSITVPAAAGVANGVTRMRVQQQESGTIPMNPCASYSWGTVVDFKVTVSGGALCANPTGVSVAADYTSATVSFTSNTGASSIEYGVAGFTQGSGTYMASVTSPYTINGLTPYTSYDIYVYDSCGAVNSLGAMATVLTAVPYCTGGPTSTADSDIGAFSATGDNMTSISYTQSCPGTTGTQILSGNLDFTAGMIYSGSVTWGTCGGNFGNAGTIWVDWDGNGSFENSEAVHTWTGTPTVTEAISISVPTANAVVNGLTRMRVMQRESGAIPMDACANYSWGAVLDIGVTISGGQLCPNPSNVTVNTAGTSATVNFTSGSGTSYLEYGPTGYVQGTGTTVTGISSGYTITNLLPATSYDVYVHDSCSTFSNASGGALATFLVPCTVFPAPYLTSFEGNTNCWTQSTTDDQDWILNSGGTSSGPGPTSASDGNEYLYLEVSFPSTAGDVAILEGPEVSFIGATNPTLIFDYHMFGNAMGTMDVEVDSALTGNWVNIWSKSGDQGNEWHLAEVALSGYGDTLAVRFKGTSIGCCLGDMAFDYVRFEPDYCFNPHSPTVSAQPTQANVSFVSVSGASSIEYGPSGFFPGTGTFAGGISSPFTMFGLAPNTLYDAIIFDSCGTNISNGLTVTFTTPCAAVLAPTSESFEGGINICWQEYTNEDLDFTVQSGSTGSGGTGPSGASDGSDYIYIETSGPVAGSAATIESQLVDFTGTSQPALRFDYHMWGLLIGTLDVEVDSALTGNWVNIWSLSGDQGNQWFTGTVSLSGYLDLLNQTRVRFTAASGGSFTSDIAIDNVKFEEFCLAIATAPFYESFEFGCYTQDTLDSYDWTISANATPSGGTGANGPSDGNLYAFTESSTSAGVGAGDSAIMVTQYIDITTLTYPELTFDYHMYDANTNQMGELRVEMSNDMGMTWMPVWSISGNQEELWHQAAVNLEVAGAGDTIGLRFIGVLGGDHDVATGTGNSWHSDISLDNIAVENGLAVDLALRDILSDYSTCASSANSVAIEVENLGFLPIVGFDFGVEVNGTLITQFYPDTINPTETAVLTLNNGITLYPGVNTIGYGFDGAGFGDLDPSNDDDFEVFVASATADGDNYSNDFEVGMDGWSGDGDWELGAPAGTVINSTGGGAASWVTSLDTNYTDLTESHLYSPCFDFSSYLSDPEISFDINWDIEDGWDGAWLEVTTDGINWSKVGTMGSGTNWYSADVSANQPIGEVWNGTAGAGSGGWVNASNRAMGTAGEGSVQFRFVMWSDQLTNNDGVGVDNFLISDWCPIDLGLTTVLFPDPADTTSNGAASVMATNGTAPYTYAWSNGTTSSLAADLAGGVTYSVVVTDANGCSDSTSVVIPFVTDVDLISTMTGLDIFPNPAQYTANVLVSFETALNVEVELMNVIGQVITSERKDNITNGEFTFDVSNMPAGMYMVRVKANNESITRRLVIAK